MRPDYLQQLLHDDRVHPAAVELALLAVDADGPEAHALVERQGLREQASRLIGAAALHGHEASTLLKDRATLGPLLETFVFQELRRQANKLLSLSRFTLPHGLARVVLAEQLYRAMSVIQNHPYHRE